MIYAITQQILSEQNRGEIDEERVGVDAQSDGCAEEYKITQG